MNSIWKNSWPALIAVALTLTAFAGPALANETGPAEGEDTSGYIRDYLSDPRRTGSLAGSILGAALSANPAGSIVGSVIGFLIGKNSMYNEDKARAQRANALYAQRDIVPRDLQGKDAPTLSLSEAQGVTFDVATPAPQRPGEVMAAMPQASNTVVPMAAVAGYSREEIARKCGGQDLMDPRLRSLCFYFQGG